MFGHRRRDTERFIIFRRSRIKRKERERNCPTVFPPFTSTSSYYVGLAMLWHRRRNAQCLLCFGGREIIELLLALPSCFPNPSPPHTHTPESARIVQCYCLFSLRVKVWLFCLPLARVNCGCVFLAEFCWSSLSHLLPREAAAPRISYICVMLTLSLPWKNPKWIYNIGVF